MVKIIVIGLVVVIGAVLIIAALRPNTFRYERSAVIHASPADVFALLNNPKEGEKWSPWVELDPDANYSYSGPESGVGAAVAWDGDKNVGAGKIIITESVPHEMVRLHMEFYKPMAGLADVEYQLTPEGDGTRVQWAMYGDVNYLGKLMSLFINCEKMVGETTMKGFENLNRVLTQGA